MHNKYLDPVSICYITFMYITDVLEPSLIDSSGICLPIEDFYLDSAIMKCLKCSESSPEISHFRPI